MNRFLAILLASFILLTACNTQNNENPHEFKKIGILLFGDSRIPQNQGFVDGLKMFGLESGKNLEIKVLNAKNDKKKLASLAEELLVEKPDLLVAGGGLEAEALKSISQVNSIPTVVLYINAIIERHFIVDRRAPGWEVTGVDNLNFELSGKRVEILHDLVPSIHNILILYYPDIKPSILGVNAARAQAEKIGLNIDARAVKSRDEIKAVMASLNPGEVDAMITVPTAPIDNAIKEIILPAVNKLSIPLMTHARRMAESGALASYGAPSYAMGKQAARFADKIFKGNKASSIPFETPINFELVVNQKELQRLNIQLSKLAASQINEYLD